MDVKFIRCSLNTLSSVPIVDGQLIFVKNTLENYLDVGEERIKITDLVYLETEADRISIETPIINKIYLVLATNKLYRYDGTEWTTVGGGGTAADIAYVNTTSHLTATNVQAAIDELAAQLENISDRLDIINGEEIE